MLPIFDLAGQFDLTIESDPPLCLLAKHEDGLMAVRIDSDVPILRVGGSRIDPAFGWSRSRRGGDVHD